LILGLGAYKKEGPTSFRSEWGRAAGLGWQRIAVPEIFHPVEYSFLLILGWRQVKRVTSCREVL
jgi:hypothetical protein